MSTAIRKVVAEDFLRKQLRRILQMLPKDKIARDEYVSALGAAAYDDNHARRIVDSILGGNAIRLLPYDLRRIGYATRPDVAGPSWGCETCDGTGWKPVVLGGVRAVEPCVCLPTGQTVDKEVSTNG